jgi:hypothetical protein
MRDTTRLSNYRAMAIGLLFFAAIGLSEYGILGLKLSDNFFASLRFIVFVSNQKKPTFFA